MNLITDNKLHCFSKTLGGDFLFEIVDGCAHPKPYEILDKHLFSHILKGKELPQDAVSFKIHPYFEFKSNLVDIVYANTKGNTTIDNLMLTARGIICGMVTLYRDMLLEEFDYTFGNKDLFRPSIVDQKILEELGVLPQYVDDYREFFKSNFFKWNRNDFNSNHYKEREYDVDGLGNRILQELEGEVFKQIGHITIDDWIAPYVNVFSDQSVGFNTNHINALIEASPSEGHFFRIIDKSFPQLNIQENCDIDLKKVSCRNLYKDLENSLTK